MKVNLVYLFFSFSFLQLAYGQNEVQSTGKCVGYDDEQIFLNRYYQVRHENDSIRLNISNRSNCSANLGFNYHVTNDTLYLTSFNKSNVYSFCWCLYEYHLSLASTQPVINMVYLDSVSLPQSESKYVYIPPNIDLSKKLFTNDTNSLGLKIGYWEIKRNKRRYQFYYGDGTYELNQALWTKTYFKNKLETICVYFPQINGSKVWDYLQYVRILERINKVD